MTSLKKSQDEQGTVVINPHMIKTLTNNNYKYLNHVMSQLRYSIQRATHKSTHKNNNI